MDLLTERLDVPENSNIILGQTHFIKSVEDLYEILVSSVPGIKFGLAFCEASGDCLIRVAANDEELKEAAIANAGKIAAGHSFIVIMRNAFPINVLNAIKLCQEVCTIYCATANPVEVIIAQTEQGRGILGVIDGYSPKGVEEEGNITWRLDLLRKLGYKAS
ncbi:MAG: adenosine-specific kinase [Deltaproteobacteria bacterium]|jgi:adenosine/AMP kinase|nr:adenosine-specific kinase [Deltaproteobacteria bacterium]